MIKSKGGRLSKSNSLNSPNLVGPTNSGPSKSIIAIPLLLVTAFCFSYIQYNSAGNGASDAGSHATPRSSQSTKPLGNVSSLPSIQTKLPPMNIEVAAPDSSQKLTSKTAPQVPDSSSTQTPQPSARSNQSLQNSKAGSNSDENEASNPQRHASKSQSKPLEVESSHN